MNFKIEVLAFDDLVSYKALIDECFGSSNSIGKYEQYVSNSSYKIFVVKDNDIIVGSVTQQKLDLFTFDFQPCLMLFNVAVKQDYRKQNIAKILLERIIEQAKSEGYQSISLTCLDSAYPAHRLYESVGFEKTNSIKYFLNLN